MTTDRSVYARGTAAQTEKRHDPSRPKDRPDRLSRPDRQDRPRRTDRQRQSRPESHQDAQVQDGRQRPFRHLNFVRNLPAYVVDEPPGLLGDDTAPNPSEASLAALGSCLAVGIHANAVARGITVYKLEIELEGDLNITGVWGTGDLSDKPVGFTDVRAKVTFEADRPRADRSADCPCTSVVAGRQHLHAAGQPRSQVRLTRVAGGPPPPAPLSRRRRERPQCWNDWVSEEQSAVRGAGVVTAVRDLSARELAPLVQKIDAEGYYPESDARVRKGRRVRAHLPGTDGASTLSPPSARWPRPVSIACRPHSACGARMRSAGTSSHPATTT